MTALALALCCLGPQDGDDGLSALAAVLKEIDDADAQLDILKGMREALKGRRNVKMPAGWADTAKKLAAGPRADVRFETLALSAAFGDAAARSALRDQVRDAKADPAARRRALEVLVEVKDAELSGVLHALLAEPPFQSAALRGLRGYANPNTPAAILGAYRQLGGPEKREALETLGARGAFARALMDAVDRGLVPKTDFHATTLRQLRALPEPEIRAWVDRTFGLVQDNPEWVQAEMKKYRALLTPETVAAADPVAGRAVYARLCMKCHTLYGVGGKVGPDLTGSNRADLEYVLENVINPNAVIGADYINYKIRAGDERVFMGLIARQDDQTVTVLTADNERIVVPRGEIESIEKTTQSMMPMDLLKGTTDADARNLVAYLRTSGQVPMQATPETASLFFNGTDLSFWDGDPNVWSVENGEIVGRLAGPGRSTLTSQLTSAAPLKMGLEFSLRGVSGRIFYEGEESTGGESTNEVTSATDGLQFFMKAERGPWLLKITIDSNGPGEVRLRNLKLEINPESPKGK
jgi:putative heme-binding domain-containing protein